MPEEVPWAYKPILGPLSATDIMSIVGTALSPLHVGYYRPYLPLGLAGQVLQGKQAEFEERALESQGREQAALALGPLWEQLHGKAPPPEVTNLVRASPQGLEMVQPFLKPPAAQKPSVVDGHLVSPTGEVLYSAPPESDVLSPERLQQEIEKRRATQRTLDEEIKLREAGRRPTPPQVIQGEEGFYTVEKEGGRAIPVTTTEGAQVQPRAITPKVLENIHGKLATIDTIKKQMEKVKAAWKPLKNTLSAGLGGQLLGTEKGQKFDVAVSGLYPFMRQLLRTPGEGSMSDYETRLAQAPLPSRGKWHESATQAQIDQLDDIVASIEAGYKGMLPTERQHSQPAPQAQPTISQNIRINPQTGEQWVLRNGKWVRHNR